MSAYQKERGQALVLIGLALIAILGFAALAVDGGRVYSEQRRAQNAADSAAYAAAESAVHGEDWLAAGLNQASLNAYTDADGGNNPGARLDVMVFHPPVDGPYAGQNEYYQAKIRNQVDQVFSQVVFPDGLEVSVEAVARGKPSGPISPGDAIHATTPHNCNGIWFHGNGKVYVNGGNINSESDRSGTPSSCHSIVRDGQGTPGYDVIVNDGGFISVGSLDFPVGTVDADFFDDFSSPPDLPDLPVPDCSGLTARSYTGGDATLNPGIYAGGIQVSGNNTEIHFNPGMYCLDGDFRVTGGDLFGEDVFFVIRSGDVQIGGNGTILLQRPDVYEDASGNQWGGMLLYMPYANTGVVQLTGGAGTFYNGTIYAIGPRDPISQDKCIVEGNNAPIGVNSSIYCYTVKLGGNSNVVVNYLEGQNFQLPPLIELMQ